MIVFIKVPMNLHLPRNNLLFEVFYFIPTTFNSIKYCPSSWCFPNNIINAMCSPVVAMAYNQHRGLDLLNSRESHNPIWTDSK